MKKRIGRKMIFAGKSMLWSLLLYVVAMLAFNRDVVVAGFSKYSSNMHTTAAAFSAPAIPGVFNPDSSDRKPSVIYSAARALLNALVRPSASY